MIIYNLELSGICQEFSTFSKSLVEKHYFVFKSKIIIIIFFQKLLLLYINNKYFMIFFFYSVESWKNLVIEPKTQIRHLHFH